MPTPTAAKPDAGAQNDALMHIYAVLGAIQQAPDKLSLATRALITGPSADGGLATTRGCNGGDEESLKLLF